MFLVSGYLFPYMGLGSFQPEFLQIHIQFSFLLLLESLLSIDWHVLYYPIGLFYVTFLFSSFGFLSAVLIV